MQDFGAAFGLALGLIVSGDPTLAEIILLSLQVSLSAVVIACAHRSAARRGACGAAFPRPRRA